MHTGPYFYRVSWQGKPEIQVQIMKKWKKPFWKHMTEAYRQKCRSCRKRDDQTHVDFDREKERLFEKGLTSNEVTATVDRLRQSNSYWII